MTFHWDVVLFVSIVALLMALYIATLLPDVASGDIAELQRVPPTLGLAHPTGYPLYSLLGFVWSHLPLGGTFAWRMNLFSAVAAAGACGVVFVCGRELGQHRVVAAAAALALGASFTFWAQATIAEVYGLAALLQGLLILALLRWRARRWPFWFVGAAVGLALAHHRTSMLMLPGAGLFVLLTRRPQAREIVAALLAVLCGLLFYLYLPWRAPPELRTWEGIWNYATGRAVAASWLDLPRLLREGPLRVGDVLGRYVVPQLTFVGALLAVLGAARLFRRDQAGAVLLVLSYMLIFTFCAAYYVNDMEVFLTPAHLVAALLLGEGAMLVRGLFPARVGTPLSAALLVLPAVLLNINLPEIRRTNTNNSNGLARAIMAQQLPQNALLVADWYTYEGLRYVQEAEKQRPDIQLLASQNPSEQRAYIDQALQAGRQVFLTRSWPDLGLNQWPDGTVWRVGTEPPQLEARTVADIRWQEGLALNGFTLEQRLYQPGEIVPLTLAWRQNAPPTRRYSVFVHIADPNGAIYGQQDREPAPPTDQWQPGDQHLDLYGPVIKPNTPPGRYRVLVGWYDFTSMNRVPLAVESSTSAATDFAVLGEIEVVGR